MLVNITKKIEVLHHRADPAVVLGRVPGQHDGNGLVVLVNRHHHVRRMLVGVQGARKPNDVKVKAFKKGRRLLGRPRR